MKVDLARGHTRVAKWRSDVPGPLFYSKSRHHLERFWALLTSVDMLWSPDSAVLYIGAVDRQGTGIDLSRVRYINSKGSWFHLLSGAPEAHSYLSDEAEKLQKGEIVRRFDFVSVVDEASLRGSDLEPLRHRSDTLADAVVNDLNIKPGQDALKAIEDNLRSDEPFESCRSLWQQMTTEPPALIRAAADGMYTPDEAMIKNDRYAPATLANGQAVSPDREWRPRLCSNTLLCRSFGGTLRSSLTLSGTLV